MSDQILVLIDHTDGQPRNASLEAVACAQQLSKKTGSPVSALILGDGLSNVAESLAQYELAKVITIEEPALRDYRPETHCTALTQVLSGEQSRLLIMAHTYQNLDLAPRLAARLKAALVSDCVGFRMEGTEPIFVRQMFRNKLHADVRVKSGAPWLVSLQSGAFSADDAIRGTAERQSKSVDLSGTPIQRQLLEKVGGTRDAVDLSKAEVIIGVGRGIKKEENLGLIRELAAALGAEIGASRPVVDSDWLERDRQIGSSGQSVSPKLYIAAGISGAIQHIVGIKNSGCIVAINTDPNAPIFNVANYGIVGDLTEIVPALTKKVKEARGV